VFEDYTYCGLYGGGGRALGIPAAATLSRHGLAIMFLLEASVFGLAVSMHEGLAVAGQ
jgi:hypothetical protein